MLAPIISNHEVASNIHLLWLEAPAIASAARPGQFVMVLTRGKDDGTGRLLRRPLSVHLVEPFSGTPRLALLFAAVGEGTRWLARQTKGAIDVLGPFGNGFDLDARGERLLMVAGGLGIAPVTFAARQALLDGRKVTLIAGARTTSSLYLNHDALNGAEIVEVTEDSSRGREGLATDHIADFLRNTDHVLACGPTEMYRSLASRQPQLGKPVQVSLEVRMGCGFGACFGCSVRTAGGMKQVCRHGPVFDLKEVVWD